VSYREENGQIVLTMTPLEYERLLMVFAMATMKGMTLRAEFPRAVENTMGLLDSLNEGNPNYRPYNLSPSPDCADLTNAKGKTK
jgi:hypothetical protein